MSPQQSIRMKEKSPNTKQQGHEATCLSNPFSCSECDWKSGTSQALVEDTNFQARFLRAG